MTTLPSFKVFISHIHEEAAIGIVLKEWIEDAFHGQVAVFVSSDPRDVVGGKKWQQEIESALRDDATRLFISLLSPESVHRPWISLEFGGAWIRGTRVLPVCHSGLTTGTLPRPLGDFQGTGIDQADVCERIINAVADVTGLPYPKKHNFPGMLAAMKGAIGESSHQVDAERDRESAGLPLTPEEIKISEAELKILKFLAEFKDRHPQQRYVKVVMLAPAVDLKPSVCDVHLAELRRRGLVSVQLNYLTGASYTISDQGARLLMDLGELH